MDLIGISRINLTDKTEGFEVLKYIFCSNWVSFYIKFLQFKMGMLEHGLILDRNELFLTRLDPQQDDALIDRKDFYSDVNCGQRINGYFTLYKQLYLESKMSYINEFYLVFTRD